MSLNLTDQEKYGVIMQRRAQRCDVSNHRRDDPDRAPRDRSAAPVRLVEESGPKPLEWWWDAFAKARDEWTASSRLALGVATRVEHLMRFVEPVRLLYKSRGVLDGKAQVDVPVTIHLVDRAALPALSDGILLTVFADVWTGVEMLTNALRQQPGAMPQIMAQLNGQLGMLTRIGWAIAAGELSRRPITETS